MSKKYTNFTIRMPNMLKEALSKKASEQFPETSMHRMVLEILGKSLFPEGLPKEQPAPADPHNLPSGWRYNAKARNLFGPNGETYVSCDPAHIPGWINHARTGVWPEHSPWYGTPPSVPTSPAHAHQNVEEYGRMDLARTVPDGPVNHINGWPLPEPFLYDHAQQRLHEGDGYYDMDPEYARFHVEAHTE